MGFDISVFLELYNILEGGNFILSDTFCFEGSIPACRSVQNRTVGRFTVFSPSYIIQLMDVLKVRVGKTIKKFRTRKHLTQQQLAEKVNLSVDFISLVERGERSPSFESLQKIADTLGVKVSMLFEEEK